jgi:SAM-dependent methyltransferase
VLHLQCHVGTDTVSLKHLGASRVVGLDFSSTALDLAAQLAADAGVAPEAARWVHADVYDAVAALGGEQFDLVYVSVGSLCWLPDVRRWAEVVGQLVKSGGRFYIRDTHPMCMTLASDDCTHTPGFLARPRDKHGARDLLVSLPYFERVQPTSYFDTHSYDGDGVLPEEAGATHEWSHPLGAIITALVHDGGLQVEFVHEHKTIDWQFMDHMVRDSASCYEALGFGGWRLPPHLEDRCPLMFSLRALKPPPTAAPPASLPR